MINEQRSKIKNSACAVRRPDNHGWFRRRADAIGEALVGNDTVFSVQFSGGSEPQRGGGDDDIHREVTEVGGGGDDRAGAGEQ